MAQEENSKVIMNKIMISKRVEYFVYLDLTLYGVAWAIENVFERLVNS